MEVNALVEAAVRAAYVESGVGMPLAGRNEPLSGLPRSGEPWTEAEDAFLRKNAGRMPEDEISRQLGRSKDAVHIRRERELKLPSPIKDPEYITGYRLAQALGMNEPRKVGAWIREGILAGEMVPYRDHDVSRVKVSIVLEWVVKPESWLYFHPEQVADPNLRRIIDQAVQAWGDAWWTSRQAADYHQVDVKDVTRVMTFGRVEGMQIKNLSGRHAGGRWAFHFFRRSQVQQWDAQAVFRKRQAK